jgi:GDP-L-fucose synthase
MNLSKNSKIFIAGHNGMVGSSILKFFRKKKYKKIFIADKKKLDLTKQNQTESYLKKIKPHFIVIAAAKVGGIEANDKKKAEFIYQNLMIQTNLIHSAYKVGINKLIFLGSSCVYPKYANQPIKERYLLSGYLEKTNDAYAVAKIAGIKMCDSYNNQYGVNYVCLMPTNLYGPNDNYNLKTSHFYPALLKKVFNAKKNNKKEIEIWGNGKSKRELMYVDDLASACEFFLKKKTKHSLINIGSGIEDSIEGYCKFLMQKLKVKLQIKYNKKKPNGTPRKRLDISLAKSYGWKSQFSLNDGFDLTYKNFLAGKFRDKT